MYPPSHSDEIRRNRLCWRNKPLLRKIYKHFHERIAAQLTHEFTGPTIELGSGIGTIKEVLPDCITTDLFPNPGIDRVENAYRLSFESNSVANIILFDIFHHLRYPGAAFEEFHRVLLPKGRVIIFDPCMSILGIIIYGLFHNEPLRLGEDIQMFPTADWTPDSDGYYSGQGNASRIFLGSRYSPFLQHWQILSKQRISAISYVASGGYSMPQLYPANLFFLMRYIDKLCDFAPILFATRLLVVLEKKVASK